MSHDPHHPRPQLTRARWRDLGGPWDFAHDDDDLGEWERWWTRDDVWARSITVPYPPESRASGVHDTGFHPVLWYRRTINVGEEDRAGRVLLHFGAVDYRATVWVNGSEVARHEGGHTPFSADLTGVLGPGAEQVVVVRAEDRPGDMAQPRGKQFWKREPAEIFYHRTSGIWQTVWLETVPRTYIAALRLTPDLDAGTLGLHVTLNEDARSDITLRVRLSLRGEVLADDTSRLGGRQWSRALSLDPGGTTLRDKDLMWSPEHPNLLDLELTLTGEGVRDEVHSYAGMRSAHVADGRFLLNGTPYYPRLVLEQGYWPDTLLAAPNAEALRREAELIKALGFNGVRVHQKVEDPRFLAWCDRLGLLLWGEMANAFVFSPEAQDRLTREWAEVVRRDRNHPCLVTWVPMNESWGAPNLERDAAQRHFVRGLYHLTRGLDSTRPVIGNDGWEHFAADIWGVHDYATDPEVLRGRYGSEAAVERTLRSVTPHYRRIFLEGGRAAGEPLMLSECGGIGFTPREGERWFGYETVTDETAFLDKYRALIHTILDCEPVAGFCYTQLTDTEQETNGLLTADRTPKVPMSAIRAINSRAARAIPGEGITALQTRAVPVALMLEEGN